MPGQNYDAKPPEEVLGAFASLYNTPTTEAGPDKEELERRLAELMERVKEQSDLKYRAEDWISGNWQQYFRAVLPKGAEVTEKSGGLVAYWYDGGVRTDLVVLPDWLHLKMRGMDGPITAPFFDWKQNVIAPLTFYRLYLILKALNFDPDEERF